jgi:hypothetical protein
MKEFKLDMSIYEVKLCRPVKTIRVFVNPSLGNPYWGKFERDKIYEYAIVNEKMSVEHSEDSYFPFSQEEFDKWFVVVEDKA